MTQCLGDLKPSNLLLQCSDDLGEVCDRARDYNRFVLKISDFGLSKAMVMDQMTRTRGINKCFIYIC